MIILTIVMMIEIPKKLGPSDVIRSVDHLSENPRKSNCGEEREAGSPTCNCAEMMMVMTKMVMTKMRPLNALLFTANAVLSNCKAS